MDLLKQLLAKHDYTNEQIAQLVSGDRYHLPIFKYSNPELSASQMAELRKALLFDVNIDDLVDPSIPVEKSHEIWTERAIEKHLSDLTIDFYTYVELIQLINTKSFSKELFLDLDIPIKAGILIYMLYRVSFIDDIVKCDFTWEQRELMVSGNIGLAIPGMEAMYFNVKPNREMIAV